MDLVGKREGVCERDREAGGVRELINGYIFGTKKL